MESKCSVSQLKSQGIKRTIKSQFALIISLIASASAFLYFTASITITFKIKVQMDGPKRTHVDGYPDVHCKKLADYSFFKTVFFYRPSALTKYRPL